MEPQQPTFTGENAIVVNEATVFRVFKEWLESNMSGGPWDIYGFSKESDGFGANNYRVKFRDTSN
jgi:hypothetical protein